jgi:hypothetical protein
VGCIDVVVHSSAARTSSKLPTGYTGSSSACAGLELTLARGCGTGEAWLDLALAGDMSAREDALRAYAASVTSDTVKSARNGQSRNACVNLHHAAKNELAT